MAENRNPPPGGAAPPGDPSMEDILASIRRILNEDETLPPGTSPAPAPTAEPLVLTEDMLVREPEPAAPPPAALPETPPEPAMAAPPAPAMPAPPSAPAATPDPSPETLLAPAVAAAASASIGSLLRAVSQDRSAAVRSNGPTIEDMVREELRPMLKDWLDQFLPTIVERLVRAEIERVVGRAIG
ncbi:DUF2497 domain-containing protein [Belnapia mucosa]|nr:DUF2497 domain-containing protein [Belnapia mucosa]